MADFLNIGKVITAVLQDNGIKNVYPVIADQGSKTPFVSYRRTGYSYTGTKDIYNFEEMVYVELTIVDGTYAGSIRFAEQIFSLLNKQNIKKHGIDVKDINITASSEEYQNELYVQRMTLEIKIEQ